jgi:hypothetical protein
MNNLVAFICGLLFGLGLIISGMTEPDKVLGFLDVSGLWNPSLGFVMAGAVGVVAVAYGVAKRRLPALNASAAKVDKNLLLGAAVFGVGWGLAGICPGPALVLLGTGSPKSAVFFLGLLGGMGLSELWVKYRSTRP